MSLEGTLSIWSSSDGQCLASRPHVFKCAPRFIKLLPDQRRVAVAGYSSDIEILELFSLKVQILSITNKQSKQKSRERYNYTDQRVSCFYMISFSQSVNTFFELFFFFDKNV